MDVAIVKLFGQFDVDVSRVLHLIAQSLQRRIQPRRAHRRGAHVHATALLTEIERRADNTNSLHSSSHGLTALLASMETIIPYSAEPRTESSGGYPSRRCGFTIDLAGL